MYLLQTIWGSMKLGDVILLSKDALQLHSEATCLFW